MYMCTYAICGFRHCSSLSFSCRIYHCLELLVVCLFDAMGVQSCGFHLWLQICCKCRVSQYLPCEVFNPKRSMNVLSVGVAWRRGSIRQTGSLDVFREAWQLPGNRFFVAGIAGTRDLALNLWNSIYRHRSRARYKCLTMSVKYLCLHVYIVTLHKHKINSYRLFVLVNTGYL